MESDEFIDEYFFPDLDLLVVLIKISKPCFRVLLRTLSPS